MSVKNEHDLFDTILRAYLVRHDAGLGKSDHASHKSLGEGNYGRNHTRTKLITARPHKSDTTTRYAPKPIGGFIRQRGEKSSDSNSMAGSGPCVFSLSDYGEPGRLRGEKSHGATKPKFNQFSASPPEPNETKADHFTPLSIP